MKRLTPADTGYSLLSHFFCTLSWTSVILTLWSKLISYV